MFRWFNILLVGAAVLSSSFVEASDFCSNARFDIGYRRDSIDWNFKIPVKEQCTKDELSSHFDDIHVLEIGLYGDTTFCDCLYGRAHANIGWILDGTHKERAHQIEDTCHSISKEREQAVRNVLDGRYTADFSVAIGAPFECWCSYVRAIPLIGYAYKTQYLIVDMNDRLVFTDEENDHEKPSHRIQPLKHRDDELKMILNECHDDKWINRWWGPFIGLDLLYDSCDCWKLFAKFEGHFSYFKGKKQALTLFDEVLDSFDASTRDAHGYVVRFGGEYGFCRCWYAGFEASFQRFVANHSKNICFTNKHEECDHDHGRHYNNDCDYDGGKSDCKKHKYSVTEDSFRSRVHLNAKLYSWALKLNIGTHF